MAHHLTCSVIKSRLDLFNDFEGDALLACALLLVTSGVLAEVVLQILLRRQWINVVRLRRGLHLLLQLLRVIRVELRAGQTSALSLRHVARVGLLRLAQGGLSP